MCAAHAADPALLTEARQALAESIPQVAVQKLKTLLAKPGVPPADRRAAELELGAAYLAAGDNDAALAAVQKLADESDAAARLLSAQVLARAGRWKEALALFEELAAQPDAPASVRLGLVESHAALGQLAVAITELEKFVRDQPQHPAASLRLVGLLIESGDAKTRAGGVGTSGSTLTRRCAGAKISRRSSAAAGRPPGSGARAFR